MKFQTTTVTLKKKNGKEKIMVMLGDHPNKRPDKPRVISTNDLENVLDESGEPRTGKFKITEAAKKRYRNAQEKKESKRTAQTENKD